MNGGPVSYVAVCKCGGWIMETIDRPGRKRNMREDLAITLKYGYKILRMTEAEMKQGFRCKCRGMCQGPSANRTRRG